MSSIVSPTQMFVRIKDYNRDFVQMSEEIQKFYSTVATSAVVNPAVGKIYACEIEPCPWAWVRVKVVKKKRGENSYFHKVFCQILQNVL